MNNMNYELKIPEFNSKIKFYFSLLFMSINDYEVLINNFGDDIDIFSQDSFYSKINDVFVLNKILENIKWNNNQINLSDKTILNLFNSDEIKNYYDSYSRNNSHFNVSDAEDLEEFYIYMLLEKVKEKKVLEYGTIYDLFDTFLDEEILNAVANLDFSDKKVFIKLFGIKGDETFEINSNDYVKNGILIKLYSYMLLKREEADIPSIIRNIIERDAYEYNFYDYIRLMCNDKTLSNEFISEMLSKMDYNSKKAIKDVFGEKLERKAKLSKEKEFKKAINNLTVVIKINKEYRKRKNETYKSSNKKKAGFEEKKKEKKPEEKTDEKKKEEIKKEEPKKEELKKEEKESQKKKKDKKEEKSKENKKSRLKNFLDENNIEKKDFEKAVELLEPFSKSVITLYYGLKAQPLELDEMVERLDKPLEDILDALENAEKKIIRLIETGEINKKKEESKKEENKNVSSDRLNSFASENNIKKDDLIKATMFLIPMEKVVMDIYINKNINSISKIADILKIDEKEVEGIIESATDKIISNLSNVSKEEQNEISKNEVKKEEKKDKKKEEKKLVSKTGSLDDLLKKKGLTKKEFYEIFNTLDSFSKTVMSLYLGLYGPSMGIDDIAKKYGMMPSAVEKIISQAESKFTKKKVKIEKLSLSELLNKNGISKDDFIKELNKLESNKKNIIKDYFGIRSISLSMEELSRKYGKSSEEINKIVGAIVKEISESKKNDNKEKKVSDNLNKFLTVNNLTKEQFLNALQLLSEEEKSLVSMYFGLNGNEMSITQIALVTKTSPLQVKSNLMNSLKQINKLGKTKDLNKNVMEQTYQNVKFKINNMYSMLLADAGFMMYLSTNPNIANMLSVISNFDLDIASKMLMMSQEKLMSNLIKMSDICESYAVNMSKNSKSGFLDEEIGSREVGRKY